MRTIHANLAAEQVKMSHTPAYKIVLTKTGETDITLEEDRIIRITDEEEPWSIKVKALLSNHDKYFATHDYKGWKASVYFGNDIPADTTRYSAGPPLWCIAQDSGSSLDGLNTEVEAWGAFDIMGVDQASDSYLPEDSAPETIKSLLQSIAGATLACFNHCVAIPITFDSEDAIIASYQPKETFRVYENGSRLAAFRWLLDRTGCIARYEDDGAIHIRVPVKTGTTYDMQFALDTTGYPQFYAKSDRTRVVIPNFVTVKSMADNDPVYQGFASDGTTGDLLIQDFHRAKLQSNDEATAMAEAILSKYQMWANAGSALTPLITNLEVMDYIKITDSREGTSITGNIGRLVRTLDASPGEEQYTTSIIFGGWLSLRKTMTDLMNTTDLGTYFGRLQVKDLYAENITADNISLYTMDDISDGDNYGRVAATSISAGKILLQQVEGDLDDITDGTNYAKIASTDISAGHLLLEATVQSTTARFTNDSEKAFWDAKPETMDQIGEGTTYQKVRATDISEGHLKLTSNVVVDGQWYDEGGVIIDAEDGIIVYSDETNYVQLASNGLLGVGGGLVQVQINASNGKLVAGAGYVEITRNGIELISSSTSQVFKFTNSGSSAYLRFDGTYIISSAMFKSGSLIPDGYTHNLGSYSQKWNYAFINYLGHISYPVTGVYVISLHATGVYSETIYATKDLVMPSHGIGSYPVATKGSIFVGSNGQLIYHNGSMWVQIYP